MPEKKIASSTHIQSRIADRPQTDAPGAPSADPLHACERCSSGETGNKDAADAPQKVSADSHINVQLEKYGYLLRLERGPNPQYVMYGGRFRTTEDKAAPIIIDILIDVKKGAAVLREAGVEKVKMTNWKDIGQKIPTAVAELCRKLAESMGLYAVPASRPRNKQGRTETNGSAGQRGG